MSIFSSIFTRDEINIPLPEMIHVEQPYVYLFYSLAIIYALALLLKTLNKTPNALKAIIAALSIIVVYLACILIYTIKPAGLQKYLAPLPFITLDDATLYINLYKFNPSGKFCVAEFFSQVASMYVLSFLVNQIYDYKLNNLKNFGWIVVRMFSTVFCIGAHAAVHKLLQFLLRQVPSGSLLELFIPHLPIVFLGSILVLFVIGSMKKLMEKILMVMNFAFEGLNGFFYKNKFGVIMNRSITTTLVLTCFTYGLQMEMEKLNYPASIPLGTFPGLTGIVVLILLFVVWLKVGRMA